MPPGPWWCSALGRSCYALPFFAASLVVSALPLDGTNAAYIAVLLYAVALTFALCLESRDPNLAFLFSDLENGASVAPSDFADIDSRCEALGRARGLTAREVQVMQLFCKGRTKAYIAETMFVTENTVRSHIKNIYVKLGVHSRQDIQRLIDAY